MFKTFDKINEFVIDLYNIDFRKRNDIRKIKRIKELWNAYITIWKIIKEKRKPFSSEFGALSLPFISGFNKLVYVKKRRKIDKRFFNEM